MNRAIKEVISGAENTCGKCYMKRKIRKMISNTFMHIVIGTGVSHDQPSSSFFLISVFCLSCISRSMYFRYYCLKPFNKYVRSEEGTP